MFGEGLAVLLRKGEFRTPAGERLLVLRLQAPVGVHFDLALDELLVHEEEPLFEFGGFAAQHREAAAPGLRLALHQVRDDVLVEHADFRGDLDFGEVTCYGDVGVFGAEAHLPAVVAVVVPVASAASAPGAAARHEAAARMAEEVPAQHEFFADLVAAPHGARRPGLPAAVAVDAEAPLHEVERGLAHQGFVEPVDQFVRLVLPGGYEDLARVERIAQEERELVLGAAQPLRAQLLADGVEREVGLRRALERCPHERRHLVVRRHQRLVEGVAALAVADGRLVDEAAFAHGPAHARLHGETAAAVLDFGGGDVDREHHELLRHAPVDGLLDGLHLDAEFFERPDHRERVGGVAAEAVPLYDVEYVGCAAVGGRAPVGLREGEELLEGGAVERLGGGVVLVVLHDLDALALAVRAQALLLVAQAVALGGLLVGGDARVEERTAGRRRTSVRSRTSVRDGGVPVRLGIRSGRSLRHGR